MQLPWPNFPRGWWATSVGSCFQKWKVGQWWEVWEGNNLGAGDAVHEHLRCLTSDSRHGENPHTLFLSRSSGQHPSSQCD